MVYRNLSSNKLTDLSKRKVFYSISIWSIFSSINSIFYSSSKFWCWSPRFILKWLITSFRIIDFLNRYECRRENVNSEGETREYLRKCILKRPEKMLLTRIEEWVFAGGRASYRRVEITSIIWSCLLWSPDVSVGLLGLSLRGGVQLLNHEQQRFSRSTTII